MITKTLVKEGSIGNKKGFCFEVYFDNRKYANVVSALFKTKIGTKRELNKYLKDETLKLYGNAE